MSGLRIIIEEIEKRIREGEDYGCSEERIAELKSLLSFAESLQQTSKNKPEKPKDISEFLQRLTTEEQEFLWEHIEKVKKLEREDIMKGAIEARVENGAFYGVKPEIRIRPESGYKTGDKVKVLIIKDN